MREDSKSLHEWTGLSPVYPRMTGRMPVPQLPEIRRRTPSADPSVPLVARSYAVENLTSKHDRPARLFLPLERTGPLGGQRDDTRSHRHHAVQLVVSLSGSFQASAEGVKSQQRAVLICPDVWHRLNGRDGRQALLLIDSESSAARMLVSPVLQSQSAVGSRSASIGVECGPFSSVETETSRVRRRASSAMK